MKGRNTLLAQNSRIKWIKDGDANSKLFHNYINKRRKRNEIVGISIGGQWHEEVDEVKTCIYNFFTAHFQKESIQRSSLVQDFTYTRDSELDNQFLISPFSEDEVREAVWSCDGNGSPGPDGFNFAFLKEAWCSLKAYLMQMMREFHEFGRLVKGIKPSFIVLIPKKEAALNLGDYRPISLIGVCIR